MRPINKHFLRTSRIAGATPFAAGRHRRRGSLYVSVLLSAATISAMGLAAIGMAALRSRASISANDWSTAQLLARAAVEAGIHDLNTTANWRANRTIGTQYPATPVSMGGGTFTWSFSDDDGSLSDDDSDSVRVVGIGRAGEATAAESVRLYPAGSAISSVGVALCSGGNITLPAVKWLQTDQTIASNGNVTATALLAKIIGNAEATGTISGSINGTQTPGAPARRLPGSSAFDYYMDNGTWVPFASIPVVSGVATIEKTVLSPGANPFGGGRNPEGIYVIDCGGSRIRIQNCRIAGTLVLVNATSNSSIEGSVRWDSAVANYPALLVNGSIELRTTVADLSESTTLTNFNPASTPYLGVADADTLDNYASEIHGLIYVSGTLSMPSLLAESQLRGSAICGSIASNNSCRFNYRAILGTNPPPGFAAGQPMKVSPASRRRESL